jgi:hypothetical protein
MLYGICDYSGFSDYLAGRRSAEEGLRRLNSEGGFPVGWIYSDEPEFTSLKELIRKRSRNPELRDIFSSGIEPSLIVVGSGPQLVVDVPQEWPATNFVLGTSPVLCVYGITRKGGSRQSYLGWQS